MRVKTVGIQPNRNGQTRIVYTKEKKKVRVVHIVAVDSLILILRYFFFLTREICFSILAYHPPVFFGVLFIIVVIIGFWAQQHVNVE